MEELERVVIPPAPNFGARFLLREPFWVTEVLPTCSSRWVSRGGGASSQHTYTWGSIFEMLDRWGGGVLEEFALEITAFWDEPSSL